MFKKIKSKIFLMCTMLLILVCATNVFAAHWTKVNTDWYFFNDQNVMEKSKWIDWKNNWYHVDEQGKMQRGWYQDKKDFSIYYLDNQIDTGHAYKYVNGIEGYLYYFDNDNRLVKSSSIVSYRPIYSSNYKVDFTGKLVRQDGSYYHTNDSDAPKNGASLGAPIVGKGDAFVLIEAVSGGSSSGSSSSGSSSSGGSGGDTPTPVSNYTIIFNTNGGSTIANQTVSKGSKITKPTNPKKSGYKFVDWYTESTLTNVYDFNTAVNSNITLYAKWEVLKLFTLPSLYDAVLGDLSTDGYTIYNIMGVSSNKIKFLINKDLTTYSTYYDLTKGSNTYDCKVGIDAVDGKLTFVTNGNGFRYPDAIDAGGENIIAFYYAMGAMMGREVDEIDLTNTYLSSDKSCAALFATFNGTKLDLTTFDTTGCLDMTYMFSGCANLGEYLNISNLNTSSVKSMRGMFGDLGDMSTVSLKSFDTSNVEDFSMMFASSASSSLDISNFNFSKATKMNEMFRGCAEVKTINLPKSDTPALTEMYEMFYGCAKLTNLDLSNFNTKNVTNMYDDVIGSGHGLFEYCANLKSIKFGANWDNGKVPKMDKMFNNCTSLETITFSEFKAENVESMYYMFNNCCALKTLDLSKFNPKKCTDFKQMFFGCTSLKSIDLTNFDTSSAINMYQMFYNCKLLNSVSFSAFKVEKVENMESMFEECSALTTLDLSTFRPVECTNFREMFYNCKKLQTIDLSNFETPKAEDMFSMFKNCEKLQTLNLEKFVTTNLEGTISIEKGFRSMFSGCRTLTELDITSFEFGKSNLSIEKMFEECDELKTIKMGNLDVGYLDPITSASPISHLFYNTKKLTKIICKENMFDKIWNSKNPIDTVPYSQIYRTDFGPHWDDGTTESYVREGTSDPYTYKKDSTVTMTLPLFTTALFDEDELEKATNSEITKTTLNTLNNEKEESEEIESTSETSESIEKTKEELEEIESTSETSEPIEETKEEIEDTIKGELKDTIKEKLEETTKGKLKDTTKEEPIELEILIEDEVKNIIEELEETTTTKENQKKEVKKETEEETTTAKEK